MCDAEILIKHTREVVAITSKRGKPRFTKPVDSGKVILSSISLQYQSDLRLLSILLNNAYQLRHQSESDWKWFILMCRQRLSNSRALQRFFSIAKRLLLEKSWLITSSETVLEKSIQSSYYEGMRQAHKDSMNTIHIGIANQDYRVKSKKPVDDKTDTTKKTKWQYSPLLQFFVHMMLIMNENLPIKNNES